MGVNRFVQALGVFALSLAAAACVGEVPEGPGTPPELPSPDAAPEPVIVESYDAVTDSSASADGYMHYVSDDRIYSVVDNAIRMWNGTSWNQISGTVGLENPIGKYFYYVSDDEIYAYVGQRIAMWDGLGNQWVYITDELEPNLNLHPRSQFHYVSQNEIYAFYGDPELGLSINMWNGQNWDTQMTEPSLELEAGGLHYGGPDAIHAVAGDTVAVYDLELATWSSLTGPAFPGMKTDFQYISDDNIHVVIARMIQQWDGESWSIMVEDAPVEIAPYFFITPAPTSYRAIGMDGLVYRSK